MNKKKFPVLIISLFSLLFLLSAVTIGCSNKGSTGNKQLYTEFVNGEFKAWKANQNEIVQHGNEQIKPDSEKSVIIKELEEVIIPDTTKLKEQVAKYKPQSDEIKEISELYESALSSMIEANINYKEYLLTAKEDLYNKVGENQKEAYANLEELSKKMDELNKKYAVAN